MQFTSGEGLEIDEGKKKRGLKTLQNGATRLALFSCGIFSKYVSSH